jgi:hypothetical protein
MKKRFDLESWLMAHSDGVAHRGGELVFTHRTGETSILVPRDERFADLLDVGAPPPVGAFYQRFVGASIGDSQLTFATTVRGGLDVSHGFRLHDFDQMRAEASGLGIEIGPAERAFLAEAAWMFLYTVETGDGPGVLRVHDRDFGTVRIVDDLERVFEDWWDLVTNG